MGGAVVGSGMNLDTRIWSENLCRELCRELCRQSSRQSWFSSLRQQAAAFRPAPARRTGFTLIELLLVIGVIAVLGTIIMGSAAYINRLSRDKRAAVTCRVLETALARYRSDYNKWPLGSLTPNNDYIVRVGGKDNQEIFWPLRETNTMDNDRKIRYLDESTLFTVDEQGRSVRLDKSSGSQPLIYVTREGSKVRYFSVEINVDTDTVKVSAPGLND